MCIVYGCAFCVRSGITDIDKLQAIIHIHKEQLFVLCVRACVCVFLGINRHDRYNNHNDNLCIYCCCWCRNSHGLCGARELTYIHAHDFLVSIRNEMNWINRKSRRDEKQRSILVKMSICVLCAFELECTVPCARLWISQAGVFCCC